MKKITLITMLFCAIASIANAQTPTTSSSIVATPADKQKEREIQEMLLQLPHTPVQILITIPHTQAGGGNQNNTDSPNGAGGPVYVAPNTTTTTTTIPIQPPVPYIGTDYYPNGHPQ